METQEITENMFLPLPGVPPILITRTEGVYLHTSSGHRIIDASGGPMAVSIGYGRPEVAEAAGAAAVADYRPATKAEGKIKKGEGPLVLELVRTRDILAGLGKRKGERLLVGFAAETENLQDNARAKLERKGCDWIVANDPTASGGAFGDAPHSVHLLGPEGEVWCNAEPADKPALAAALLVYLITRPRRRVA